MNNRIYEYWAASLQDGYIGNLTDIVVRAGGAEELYRMSKERMISSLGLSERLAGYIDDNRPDTDLLTSDYDRLSVKGVSYVNHDDNDFPEKLRNIASPPYGIFVKGSLPDPLTPSVAIVGSRECTEYGRLMAEYFGDRLAKEGVQIISGMAWGIDGISQGAAVAAGGHSFAVMGCGVDIAYPAKNMILYRKLCTNGNGVISEYAPGSAAESKKFPPRNRIISALCDVLIVVEARARSGTLITVDMAIDQGRTVMVVPGRLTDSLSVGCLNLLYQGALPATSIESVLEQLDLRRRSKGSAPHVNSIQKDHPRRTRAAKHMETISVSTREIPKELAAVYDVLTIEPQSTEAIANAAGLPLSTAMVILTKLEIEGAAKEVWPGYFIRKLELA